MKLYTVTISGCPASGPVVTPMPVVTPIVRAVRASGLSAAVGKALREVKGLDRHTRRGYVNVRIGRAQ